MNKQPTGQIGLFLDDERFPKDVTWIKYPKDIEWIIVRNHAQFLFKLMSHFNKLKYVSFDNDLCEPLQGIDCARHLCNSYLDTGAEFPIFYIHSQNTIASDVIKSILSSAIKVREYEKLTDYSQAKRDESK